VKDRRSRPAESSETSANLYEALRLRFARLMALLCLAAVALLALTVSHAAAAEPPTVVIDPTITTGYTNAEVSGTVDTHGEQAAIYAEFATSEAGPFTYRQIGAIPQGTSGTTPVSGQVTGLDAGTTYYFRLDAEVPGVGETYSPTPYPTATTEVLPAPTATIEPPTAITASTAHFAGQVDPNAPGPAPQDPAFDTAWQFRCTPSCPGLAESVIPGDNASHVVSEDASGLEPNTEYEVVLFAKNAGPGVESVSLSFTTSPAPPGAPAGFTESVGSSEAVVVPTIDTGNIPTSYYVQYGPTTSYGSRTAEVALASATPRNQAVTVRIPDLAPGTTYHWRVVATNALGSVPGPDREFATSEATPVSGPGSCPNETLRNATSGRLPDCRAYELVSSADKDGGDIRALPGLGLGKAQIDQAAVDGDALTYSTFKTVGEAVGAPYSSQYMSIRAASGWVDRSINPPKAETLFAPGQAAVWDLTLPFKAFTSDLKTAWVTSTNRQPLTPDAAQGNVNLYAYDSETGELQALTKGGYVAPGALNEPNVYLPGLLVEGFSETGSHQVFSAGEALIPGIGTGRRIYDFHEGTLSVVSVLPGASETPTEGSVGGEGGSNFFSGRFLPEEGTSRLTAVSSDGSRIFWSHEQNLYVRINDSHTVTVSESGEANFLAANSAGTKVLYQTIHGEQGQYGELFEFDVATETTQRIAGEEAGVVGESAELSSIYLVSKEALAAGATAGENNLYLDHEGVFRYIADLDAADLGSPIPYPSAVSAAPKFHVGQATPDGGALVFMSTAPLTGYENTDVKNGEADFEVFRYGSATGQLLCISCNPSNVRSAGQTVKEPFSSDEEPETIGSTPNLVYNWAAAWIPSSEISLHGPRVISDNGNRVFFNSFEPLVPRDRNGAQDVYEWEANGEGTCGHPNGCVNLISSGESQERSELIDSDRSGANVFLETNSSLVPQDNGLVDIYDAREDGGFPASPAAPPACEGEGCQSPATVPAQVTPGSSSFAGPGNKRASTKKQQKKKKKHHKKKHKKTHHKKTKKKNNGKNNAASGSSRRSNRNDQSDKHNSEKGTNR
jgi:hypothetical protein